jgi:peptidoglycan/LPS O-acetylase OafA/YrhL
MGVFRLTLAALVVLFHFGGLSWIVGRVAVFAFYALSGFLIFQVLDRVYLARDRGVGRFFVNRLIRLGPLYVVYALLGLIVVSVAGLGAGDNELMRLAGESPRLLLARTLTLDPTVYVDGRLPVLLFNPPLVPQGWSIGVEAVFYLVAPVAVFTTRRRPAWLMAWGAAGLVLLGMAFTTAGIDFDRFQVLVYKNAVASAVVFVFGGALYYVRRRWGACVDPRLALLAIAVWLWVLIEPPPGHLAFPLPSSPVFAQYLWGTLVVASVVALSGAARWRALDSWAGSICYGVYLNQFVVGSVITRVDAAQHLGAPGGWVFGLAVVAGSMGLATVTYYLVEHPFDRVRARLRGEITRAPGTPVPVRLQAGIVVATLVLALLASPVGAAVERLNGEAAGAVPPLSGELYIRWTPATSAPTLKRLEEELGLPAAQPDARDPRHRTWSYRLRLPTKARVRALVTHPAVEDTARIDRERFEIAQ